MAADFLAHKLPGLRSKAPVASLGSFPTPVVKLENLGRRLGCPDLYVKQDGACGQSYGGNKVRKLEFFFGDVIRKQFKEVVTFGYAGSNHALATAVYAKKLGLKCSLMLLPQINAPYVQKNLLYDLAAGAFLQEFKTERQLLWAVGKKVFRDRMKTGSFPYIIPPGGSNPLGALGYVDAALELGSQIRKGELPEPEYLYVPLGTMGTVAGLVVGLKLAGLATKVVGVQVVPDKMANTHKLKKLVIKTYKKLCEIDRSCPRLFFSGKDFQIRKNFFGGEYAHFTKEGKEACTLAQELEGINLDGTYTGKAMAALISDLYRLKLQKAKILFWGTYNSICFEELIKGANYEKLPSSFHKYFAD